MQSDVRLYLEELVFKGVNGFNYTVDSFDVTKRKVDHLAEYMDRFGDKYDLHRIAKLPEDEINVGSLTVSPIITSDMEIDENMNTDSKDYLIIVEDFDIP